MLQVIAKVCLVGETAGLDVGSFGFSGIGGEGGKIAERDEKIDPCVCDLFAKLTM